MQKEIGICIDVLTECLIDRASGKRIETTYREVTYPITQRIARELKKAGWLFDWSIPQKCDCNVYELFAEGDERVQGMVAFMNDKGYTYLNLVESAPHNRGKDGNYMGVGGHLFAIACKHSFEAGNEGYVQFESKTKLIEHYQKMLGAKLIAGNVMYLDTEAALALVERYFGK